MAAVEDQAVSTGSAKRESRLQDLAKRHLWMHFTQMAGYEDHEIPIITRGEGCYVFDEHGNRYLDGLAALFCVNIGHGRGDVAQAGADQAKELGDRAGQRLHGRPRVVLGRVAEAGQVERHDLALAAHVVEHRIPHLPLRADAVDQHERRAAAAVDVGEGHGLTCTDRRMSVDKVEEADQGEPWRQSRIRR
jgi:hypothetical protein